MLFSCNYFKFNLFNLSGADWKLHLHGRVFYEGNCYEGTCKKKLLFAKHIITVESQFLKPPRETEIWFKNSDSLRNRGKNYSAQMRG